MAVDGAGPTERPAVVEVYGIGGGGWGWRYRERDTDVVLNSNNVFSTRAAAVESGRRAYPDLVIAEDDAGRDPEADAHESGSTGPFETLLGVIAVMFRLRSMVGRLRRKGRRR